MTTLYRCWDAANKKHQYASLDNTCVYDECWNSTQKKHGVYCDSTFYPRCYNYATGNWQVEVECCYNCNDCPSDPNVANCLTCDGTSEFCAKKYIQVSGYNNVSGDECNSSSAMMDREITESFYRWNATCLHLAYVCTTNRASAYFTVVDAPAHTPATAEMSFIEFLLGNKTISTDDGRYTFSWGKILYEL